MKIIARLKRQAKYYKQQVKALSIAYRDPRTPWYAKAFGALVVAYALSPIDLIPDFIPILGYLDDLIILPIGILLTLRMIPPQVLAESRARAQALGETRPPRSTLGLIIIAGLWGLGLLLAGIYCVRLYQLKGPIW